MKTPCTMGLLAWLALALPAVAAPAPAKGLIGIGEQARRQLHVTVYTQDLGVIRDSRTAPAAYDGKAAGIAFTGISSRILPETCVFDGVRTLEQNFNYDIADLQSMLRKSIGHTVYLHRTNPSTGEAQREQATVLNAGTGALVLQRADGSISTGLLPGETVLFPKVMDGLWLQPTLTAKVAGKAAPAITLTCQTRGLSWAADYVAVLDAGEDRMHLVGLVTLSNNTGVAYPQARLSLLAGDPRILQRQQDDGADGMYLMESVSMAKSARALPQQEAVADYFLYTFPQAVDIDNRQEKQLTLLDAAAVPVSKRYYFAGQLGEGLPQHGPEQPPAKALVRYEFDNTAAKGLGRPLPKGIVRFNKPDSSGQPHFIGAGRIGNVAEGETVRIVTGEAFGVSLRKTVSAQKRSAASNRPQRTVTYRILNSTAEAGVLVLEENGWRQQVVQASVRGEQIGPWAWRWELALPAGKTTELTYTVEYLRDDE